MQLAGNQEWESLEPSCVYFPSGAADVPSHLPPQTSFLCSVCTQGRRRLPLPRSETLLSLNVQHQEQAPLCPNYKCPEEKQIGPASSDAHLCPCTEEAGLGLGWACVTSLMGAGRSQKGHMDKPVTSKCVISPVLLFGRKALSLPWLALPGICRLRF